MPCVLSGFQSFQGSKSRERRTSLRKETYAVMKFNVNKHLKREDHNMLSLRHLYEQFGYVHYKMNKFEEYDLYVTNKDFLTDSSIITFTDTNGKLLALKPDVTLSIVKNYRCVPGTVQKVYYNENIYRPSKSTKTYKEIMQMGLECIGTLDTYNISEVLVLAARSLETVSSDYILDVSHMGVIRGFLEALQLKPKHEAKFLTLLREKNCHGIRALFDSLKVDEDLREKAITLASTYGLMEHVLPVLESLCLNPAMDAAVEQLSQICDTLMHQGFSNVHLDFSIEGDMAYYNGILFRGYIDGIPSSVLSGGQYDELMEKMGKSSGAIGFAINMDLLENYENVQEDYDVDVLLLYGTEPADDPNAPDDSDAPEDMADQGRSKISAAGGVDCAGLMNAVTALIEQGYTVQAQKKIPEKLKYRKLMEFQDGEVKEIG